MGRRRKANGAVSASVLSQMGVCERLVVFEHFEGKRPTPRQRVALQRGLRAHRRFESEAVTNAKRVGRCFIATHVFGDGLETQALRRFRDSCLRSTPAGRRLILGYYRVAPTVCRAMERWPWLEQVVRKALLPLVGLLIRRLRPPEDKNRG
ncbi:MAG: hypothetical protein IIZ92_30265 [Aquincola sp.]|nr:hypothetical protein [Aquincola sp.]|tara:strand:- start:7388 stop:7840 length:453 start_codon:yes stop_codon:yes gene_type:complete